MHLENKINLAYEKLKNIIPETTLEFAERLSKVYKARIYFKREDLNETRSFKIRGAFNKILSLTKNQLKNGVVTASAGNHAQGVALACFKLKIKGVIFIPQITPLQKVQRVKYFGDNFVECKLIGFNFDEAQKQAQKFAKEKNAVYIHPFDDLDVIAGQGTIAFEIYKNMPNIDYVLAGIGGGGLISGIGAYLKSKDERIKVYGVEPSGASAMYQSLKANKIIELKNVDTFVDGVAVRKPGKITFNLCKKYLDKALVIPEGAVAQTMVELYQNEGVIAEPAGALAPSALEFIKNEIKNKTVVCVISGGNNDVLRYPEILERSLVYQDKKHYFLIEFAQKPGQLKNFVNNVLGPQDDIVLFEYIKKNNKEKGPALVGIELQNQKDLKPLLEKLKKFKFTYKKIRMDDPLYSYLIK
jgi:threonine dehydratase